MSAAGAADLERRAQREHRCDVVVVGAGLSGLVAAREVAAGGRSVRCHEARDRVGGRAWSRPIDGAAVDLGASWCWPDEPAVQQLAAELGVATFPQHLQGDALFEPDGRGPQRLAGNPVDVPALRFAGGAQALAQGVADRLPAGALRLGDPVVRIAVDPEGVVVTTASGATTAAGQAVLALPPALAVADVELTPPLPAPLRELAAATAVWMSGTVKAVAVYDHPFWHAAGLAGAVMSHLGPFREIHDHSGPGGSPAALFGFATAASLGGSTLADAGAAFVRQLVRLFGPGAATPQRVDVADWSRERWTAPAAGGPQSTAGFGHPVFQEAVHGRIHWAGTETAPRFAGHLEGAVRAGVRAAAQALAGLEQTAPAGRDRA